MSINRGLVRPCIEYTSHVWGDSTHTALLDRVDPRLRLFDSSVLLFSPSLLPLKFCHQVASLSIFYCYFYSNCSSELANCMPPPPTRPRCICLSTQAHPFIVQIPYTRVNQHLHSFIPFTGKLWNDLPLSVFPPAYDLNSFKRRVSGHLSSLNWPLFWTNLFVFIGAVSRGLFFFFFFVIKPHSVGVVQVRHRLSHRPSVGVVHIRRDNLRHTSWLRCHFWHFSWLKPSFFQHFWHNGRKKILKSADAGGGHGWEMFRCHGG